MKWLLTVGIVFLIGYQPELSAACPITHAYLTKILLKKFPKYTKAEEQDFMIGTLFPDIRYLGDITRKETHYNSMTLDEVLSEPSPFLAGLKFHSYVDLVRENLVAKEAIYDKLRQKVPYQVSSFLKLIEDEYLYSKEIWDDVSLALIQIHPDERKYGISDAGITKWHKLLNLLFVSSPSYSLTLFSLTGQGALTMTAEDVKTWNDNLKPYLKEPIIIDWMQLMISHFETNFEKHASPKITITPASPPKL